MRSAIPALLLASLSLVAFAAERQKLQQVVQNTPESLIGQGRPYGKDEFRAQVIADFTERFLEDPPAALDLADAPSTGPKSAPIVLVEFADFQCPYCAQARPVIESLKQKYGDKLRLVYLHLPLESIHPEARAAAQAAWAASRQGRFFEYHDLLFANQSDLSESLYEDLARALNLDLGKFNRDRTSYEAKAAIDKDIRQARALRVASTPSFFLNGVRVQNLGQATFEALFQVVLDKKKR